MDAADQFLFFLFRSSSSFADPLKVICKSSALVSSVFSEMSFPGFHFKLLDAFATTNAKHGLGTDHQNSKLNTFSSSWEDGLFSQEERL